MLECCRDILTPTSPGGTGIRFAVPRPPRVLPMPIRFPCPHCSQKLSVSSSKAGSNVNCPRCKQELTIPQVDQKVGVEPAGRAGDASSQSTLHPGDTAEDDPFAQFAFFDEMELVYDTTDPAPREAPKRPAVDYDRVSVPRVMLYAQGALLGVLALVCFSIGLLTGGAFFSTPSGAPSAAQPCVISGAVTYSAGNRTLVDAGAVVIAVPQVDELDERAPVSGLRPLDPEPRPMHRGVEIIRSIGGAYGRADDKGRFELRLPNRGSYFVLVISRRAQHPTVAGVKTADLLKMGRYFDVPADLIGKQKYQWTAEIIRGDRKFNAEF